jgi:16S rRNA (cytidine1402-2'-O)-methyltransferase
MARLFVVSTPIGNLGDMTYRAVDVLRSVARVLTEDTRRTAILFKRYGIETRRYSAHAHNEAARTKQVLGWLEAGEDLALVSDAGTPLLSDPGARLVRAAIDAGHDVVPVPGASAVLAALVASGIEAERFTFYGFLPRSGPERKRILAEAAGGRLTSVFFEAPGRVHKLLTDLATVCEPGRRLAIARELTKLHETVYRGTLSEAAAYYAETPIRGEVVVVLSGTDGPEPETASADPEEAARMMRRLLEDGWKPSAAAKEVARRHGMARSEAYRLALQDGGAGISKGVS